MVRILIIFILMVLGNDYSFSQSKFNDSILLSKDRSTVFVIRICQNGEENKYVITRARLLHRFISRELKLNFQYDNEYHAFIANIIQNKECLTAPDSINISEYFKKVEVNHEVDSVAQYGSDIFIEYFFQENGYIKNKKYNNSNAIINQLFEWDIRLKFDSYSGSVYIEELLQNWCKKNETFNHKYID